MERKGRAMRRRPKPQGTERSDEEHAPVLARVCRPCAPLHPASGPLPIILWCGAEEPLGEEA
jgi:hypothetical protein